MSSPRATMTAGNSWRSFPAASRMRTLSWYIDRRSACADEYLQILVLGHLSSSDGLLHHEQRGALYRGDDGAARLRLSFFFDENPFPDVVAGRAPGDSCAGCGGAFELSVESRWEAGESTPRGHVVLIESGTLLGEVGAF